MSEFTMIAAAIVAVAVAVAIGFISFTAIFAMYNDKKALQDRVVELEADNKHLTTEADEIAVIYGRCVKLFVRSVRNDTQIWPDDLGYALYGEEWETKALEIKT